VGVVSSGVKLAGAGAIAVAVLVTGCTSPGRGDTAKSTTTTTTTPTLFPSTIAVAETSMTSRSDVVSLRVGNFPDGPYPVSLNTDPLEAGTPGAVKVFALVPSVLPPPVPRPDCPHAGNQLIVTLRDATTLIYGPCSMPAEIKVVVDALLAARHPSLAAIHVRVLPAGPVLDVHPGDARFDEFVNHLPWPLRRPGAEPSACPTGAIVELDGTDGGAVTYGPCNRPGFVDEVLSEMSRAVPLGPAFLAVTVTTSVITGAGAPPFTFDTTHTLVVHQGDRPTLTVRVVPTRPVLIVLSPQAFTGQISNGGSLDVIGPFCAPTIDLSTPTTIVCNADAGQIIAGATTVLGPEPTGPVARSSFPLTLRTADLGVGHYVLYETASWRPADDPTATEHPVNMSITFDVLPAARP